MINGIDQKDAWLQLKWGRFSASEIHKLLSKGRGNEMFGSGAITYIEQVARQAYTLFNDDENAETYAMKMGKAKEAEAFTHYSRLIGFTGLEYYGESNPIFKEYCPESGCSPDCIAFKPDGTVSFGAEFKNPASKAHWSYLRNIKDQWDLRKECEEYYAQIQFTLMCYDAELWHFVSYNEYYPFKDRMLIIEVKPDKNYQTNLKIRLDMGKKKKAEFLEEMKNRHKLT